MRVSGTPQQAFLIKKTISRSVYGVIRLCVILKRRENHKKEQQNGRRGHCFGIRDEDAEWESTEDLAVVKASSWHTIRRLRGRHLEDPIKEISCMQLVGNYHDNVLGCIDVLQDDDYLYTIMPYCEGGDLFGRIMSSPRRNTSLNGSESSRRPRADSPGHSVDEPQARIWFRQLLSALGHLQQKGVCHRDISLDNIMVDENDHLVLIDMGMALRVPYTDPVNYSRVTDVSEGQGRRFIQAQGQGGKLMYLAPEIVNRDEAFDGFAIDLWASGVVLFVLLVGLAPFKWAHESDKRYAKISKGNLREMMEGLNIPISEEACDLLQNMFWRDPAQRLTLAQVEAHPWVRNKKFGHHKHQPKVSSPMHPAMMLRGVIPA
jgi:serine/threonine protein kinase